ncbi:MAG: DNA-binding transcriptional MerR regulator [Polaribacter sp.]|jgi:DNA-binding transcriptional MerR regulator
MSMFDNDTTKLYYSIGEIATQFKVSKSLIRFWEAEFDLLKPHKNSKGDRRFTKQNIDQFQIIYTLVKERGFTLDGAKKEIKNNKENLVKKLKTVNTLKNVRAMLVRMTEEK